MSSRTAQGATVASLSLRGRLAAWFSHHQSTARSSIAALFESLVSSLMTWLVIGIALALPAIFYLILVNVSAVSGDWDGNPRISLYLSHDLSVADGRALAQSLSKEEGYTSVVFVSPDEALADFSARSGFGDILDSLPENPLPSMVELQPLERDLGALRLQVAAFEDDERIDTIVFDLEWIERLFALIALGERLVMALSLVLASGVVLVIGNTIRLAIENRRSEIEIIKLVGGTDAFVRRPFLYLGFWFGLGGGIVALLLVWISLFFLAYPVELIAQSYRDAFSLAGLTLGEAVSLLLLSSALGTSGAVLAVSRHLRQIEPA